MLEIAAEHSPDVAGRSAPLRRRINRGTLPAGLPRIETVIEPEDTNCSCCKRGMALIGEDVAERLDIVPAQLRVQVIRRPKYACRSCSGHLVQAPAPARAVTGGLPSEALIAHVIVSKYADHQPLYRQAQILARQGVSLDRSTLADWVGRGAWWLRPLHAALLQDLRAGPKLFADETHAPVLDPGRGRTKTGQLWAYARDDRPWCGPAPPAVAYVYAPSRSTEQVQAHLAGFSGILQVDGYAAYPKLARSSGVTLAFCWSHARRGFYDIAVKGHAPVATEALKRIQALYAIEAEIRGQDAETRRRLRQERARPVLEDMKAWFEDQLSQLSRKSETADAINYALIRWPGLTLYLEDGRIEIDSNTVERSIRPLALTRKNALFAGSDGGGEHWAMLASLIETCKLNGINPQHYIADVLTKLVNGHPINRIEELLPWKWQAQQPSQRAA
jgi:Transposase and inactivated derivatives